MGYEFLGTTWLIFAILVSGGDKWAVVFQFFLIIIWAAPVSGGHFNTSLTIGTYIAQCQGKYKKNLKVFLTMLAGQWLGCLNCVAMSALIIYPVGDEKLPKEKVPLLCPKGINSETGEFILPCDTNHDQLRPAIFFQFILTFIFMFTVLNFFGKYSGPTKDGVLGSLASALSLFATLSMGNLEGGLGFNPNVALALLTWGISQTEGEVRESQEYYAWVFIVMPILAGIAAGLAQIYHENNCIEIAGYSEPADDKVEMTNVVKAKPKNQESPDVIPQTQNTNEPLNSP